MKAKRIYDAIKNEGILASFYLTRNKISQKMSEQHKYKAYIRKSEKAYRNSMHCYDNKPLFSIVVIGNNQEAMASVQNQTYQNVEILIVDQNMEPHDKIFCTIPEALQKCNGDFIGFMNEGDLLHQGCLQAVANRLNERKEEILIYTDEDQLNKKNDRCNPYFKPDFSPDTLRSFFYIGRFFCVRKDWILEHGFTGSWSGDWWDYAFVLWLSTKIQPQQIGHIRQVLYHRKNQKYRDLNELVMMKKSWIEQNLISAHTEIVTDCHAVRIVYEVTKQPLVSIIIPSKDNPELLETCLNSIIAGTQYDNYEIIVVDNGSREVNHIKYEKILACLNKVYQYHYEKMEFNFSKMCNIGRKLANGELLLFLNDDIEVMGDTRHDWLDRMIGHSMQDHIGAVGVKLYYPNSTLIQHTGIINYKYGAAHTLSKQDDKQVWDNGRNRLEYNYISVTGACMMVKSIVFDEVGGFNERLAVTFNDIELCYRMNQKGYYCVVRNDVVLYHHESITRGEDAVDEQKLVRNLKERDKLYELHPEFVYKDPFYSPYLSQIKLDNSMECAVRSKLVKPFRWTKMLSKSKENVTWKIEALHIEESLRIEGYAFMENERYNSMNQVYVILEDEDKNRLLLRAYPWYNATLPKQLNINKRIHLSAFTVYADKEYLKGVYTLGVYLKNPLSGKCAWDIGKQKVILK